MSALLQSGSGDQLTLYDRVQDDFLPRWSRLAEESRVVFTHPERVVAYSPSEVAVLLDAQDGARRH